MKILFFSCITIVLVSFNAIAQDLSPYIKIGESNGTIQDASELVIKTLKENSFIVLGSYNPASSHSMKVIVFTNNALKNTVVKVGDRGALAAVTKVGLVKKDGQVTISYTNPDYILRAYLREHYMTYRSVFEQYSVDLKTAFKGIGNDFEPFGGTVAADKLKKYHYKIMMPYFTDPVSLQEFSSFEEGLKIIDQNLKNKKGNTKKVYKLVYPGQEVAVFGVGLQSKEDGEAHFLPKIGVEHAAALTLRNYPSRKRGYDASW